MFLVKHFSELLGIKHTMKNLFVPIFLLIGSISYGQQAWTLEKCVEYAYENNLQIQQSALSIEQARVNNNAAKANALPSLNFSTGYFWQFGRAIDPVTNTRIVGGVGAQTNSSTLSASWLLFGGLQNHKSILQSKVNYLAATYRKESIRYDVAINIAAQYLQVLFDKEVVNINNLLLENTEKLYAQTAKKYNAGAVAKGDLLQVEAQRATDEQNLVIANNALDLSLLQLVQTLQLESVDDFDVVTPTMDIPESYLLAMTPRDIYDQALDLQPKIKSARLDIESSEYGISINKAGYIPRLTLNAQLNTNFSTRAIYTGPENIAVGDIFPIGQVLVDPNNPVPVFSLNPSQSFIDKDRYTPFGSQYSNNFNQFVGVNLQVPIFNNFSVRRNVTTAKIQLETNKIAYEQAKLDFRQTIERAHSDALASYKAYKSATKSVESNTESFKYADKRRLEGAINQYDHENARILLLNAISQQLQAKYDYIFKIKVLEFYLNNTLSL